MESTPRLYPTAADKIIVMSRIARLAGGFTLLGAGTAMLVLPGPGILAIMGGLALLERDLPWAKRITDRFRPGQVEKTPDSA